MLAARVREGEATAEEDLVRRFRPGLVALMRARTRDRETAPELAHDVLMGAIAALRDGKLRDGERLAAFIHGVAKNVLASHYRRRAVQPTLVPLDPDLDLSAPDHEEERGPLVRRAVAELEPLDRQVLEMTLVLGMKPGEIAPRLGLSPEAVRMRKMRSTRRVAERVRDWLRSG